MSILEFDCNLQCLSGWCSLSIRPTLGLREKEISLFPLSQVQFNLLFELAFSIIYDTVLNKEIPRGVNRNNLQTQRLMIASIYFMLKYHKQLTLRPFWVGLRDSHKGRWRLRLKSIKLNNFHCLPFPEENHTI